MKKFLTLFLACILCGCTTRVDPQPETKPNAGIGFGPEKITDIVTSGCMPHQWKVEFTPEDAALWDAPDMLYEARAAGTPKMGFGETPSQAIADGQERACKYEKKLAKYRNMAPQSN